MRPNVDEHAARDDEPVHDNQQCHVCSPCLVCASLRPKLSILTGRALPVPLQPEELQETCCHSSRETIKIRPHFTTPSCLIYKSSHVEHTPCSQFPGQPSQASGSPRNVPRGTLHFSSFLPCNHELSSRLQAIIDIHHRNPTQLFSA